jgi:peptide/nickel transport system substrate-binding protein
MIFLPRRLFLAGVAGTAVTPRIAAAQAAGDVKPVRGGTMRMSVDQSVNVLNPLLSRVDPEYLVGELLYSGLTRLTLQMTAEPDLAESWTSNAALTEWRFRLRQGLKFHDGTKCTANDVVATFNTLLDPHTASPGRTNVGPISKVVAEDDQTVLFQLSSAYADMPVALAFPNARIIPAPIATGGMERLTQEAIGTGPFKLAAYAADRRVLVERNPDYYDPTRPYLDGIELVVYPDPTAEAAALLAGDTDLIAHTTPSEFPRFAGQAGVVPLRVASGLYLNVVMRCNQKPFDDIRVRQALALTVDRPAMVGFVAQEYGTPGDDTPISSAYRFYKAFPMRTPDIEKAKQLLAAAGYPGGIDLTLVASDTPDTRSQLAEALSQMAAPAGFRIKVQTMPHATYLAQIWKKGTFYVGYYNTQPTEDGVFSLLYTSDAAWNETHWNNPAFDQIVAEARGTADVARRKDLYDQAQQMMYEQVPTVIPTFFDLLSAKRSYVQGYALNPRGLVFALDRAWMTADAPKRS